MTNVRALLTAIALISAIAGGAHARLRTEDVAYRQGDAVLEGYLAYDDSFPGPRPGILIAHEWTGLGSYVKGRAEQLARIGLVVFAADIYGKGVRPADRQEAAKISESYLANRPLMRARARAALDELGKNPRVDPKRIAAIGYCFGGAVVLELARSGAPLAGAVTFHGELDTPHPEDDKNIRCKVLSCTGANDPFITQEKVDAFWKEMRDAGVDWQLNVYSGAVHSFTNPDAGNDPSVGAAYNAEADHRSWRAMTDFLDEIFR